MNILCNRKMHTLSLKTLGLNEFPVAKLFIEIEGVKVLNPERKFNRVLLDI